MPIFHEQILISMIISRILGQPLKYFCFPLPDPVLQVWVSWSETLFLAKNLKFDTHYRLSSGPYFSYFSLLFRFAPTFSYFFMKTPYYPYFFAPKCYLRVKIPKIFLARSGLIC